jgi:uncharacterized protein
VKIRIEDITADAKDIAFAEPELEINRILSEGPIREYHLDAPVDVAVSYYRAGTELFFTGSLISHTTAICARCAEEFDAATDRPFRFVLSPKAIGYDSDTLRAEDLEFSLYEGSEVDLSPLIREQVLLALPTRPLCREDCLGLCPHCGINLNHAECDCASPNLDPRLEALRSIKLPRS